MSSMTTLSSVSDPFQAANFNAFVQFVNNFNAIGNALQAGNLSEAQAALGTFQRDLPGAVNSQASAQPFGGNADANADFATLASALQSGDMPGAQQAFASLQDDLQGAHRGRNPRHYYRSATNSGSNPGATPGWATSAQTASGAALLDLQA